MTLILLALAIALLLALRVPVPFAFLGPSLVYMAMEGQSLGMALRTVTNAASSFPLLAVPLFIFLGALANHAGIADRLFPSASRKGWNMSIRSPSRSHRARISSGDSGAAMRSASMISTPSKPASAQAWSLSTSPPDRQTEAIEVCMAVNVPVCTLISQRCCPINVLTGTFNSSTRSTEHKGVS